MLTDLAKQFNWLDITFIILLIRICYVAQDRGALVEIFKVLGVLIGILLSFENFNVLGAFIQEKLSLAPELINFVCLLALLIFGYFISMVVRDLVLKFVKAKDKLASLDRIAARAPQRAGCRGRPGPCAERERCVPPRGAWDSPPPASG